MATTMEEILRPSHPLRALKAQGEAAAKAQTEREEKRQGAADGVVKATVQGAGGAAPGMDGAGLRAVQDLARATVETTVPAPGKGNAGAQTTRPARMSYEELWERTHPQPTQEELERERKREQREKVFAAIGDGISALSNLYFTSQGAPNMYDGRQGASKRARERWDKLAAERKAAREAYVQGKMRARQMDEEQRRADAAEREKAVRLNFDLWKGGDDAQRAWADLYRKQQKDADDRELGKGRLEEQKRHNKEAEANGRRANSIDAGRLALARKQFGYEQERDKDEDMHGIAVQTNDGSTAVINVKKRNWTPTNIGKLYWLLGGGDIVVEKNRKGQATKTRKPTTEEMEQFIGANMVLNSKDEVQARQVQNALDYLEGLE